MERTLSPKESSCVCHNEFDVVGMGEVTNPQLIIQTGVGQNHHLHSRTVHTYECGVCVEKDN